MTLEQFEKLPFDEVFKVVIQESTHCSMDRDEEGCLIPIKCLFVAKKGKIQDWALYSLPVKDALHRTMFETFDEATELVKTNGDKVYTKSVILDVTGCDEETFKLYRL